MFKKIFIVLLAVIAVLAVVIFIYRYQILQYSAESLIRNNLPPYVKIDRINFRPQEKKLVLNGFRILNPPGFSGELLEIDEVVCAYKMKGENVIDGIEILEPAFKGAVLVIERLGDGSLNILKMEGELAKSPAGPGPAKDAPSTKAPSGDGARYGTVGGRKISDIVKLPESFSVSDSKIVFVDRLNRSGPHMLTLENINSTLMLRLDDLYSRVLSLGSGGEGLLNGKGDEVVKWSIVLNPTTPKLTMSNRFEVYGLEILPFEPYYDRYSPLVFKGGRFSGTLIFDFDNGSIGSSNELRLAGLQFYVKPGYESAAFWEATVPGLVKYFTVPSGEIVFDFKIKGEMSDPKFHLGPVSKQALTSMAIDKVSDVIQKFQKGDDSGGKSEVDKVKEYIELFKGVIKDK